MKFIYSIRKNKSNLIVYGMKKRENELKWFLERIENNIKKTHNMQKKKTISGTFVDDFVDFDDGEGNLITKNDVVFGKLRYI